MNYSIARLYLTGILLSSLIFAHAQPINNGFGDVTLPSPQAASLGKFGEVPVSYFTGVPSIGIHIYTVTQGTLSLPISVNYHPSGVRVAEVASWVGLGWNLNTGGMISRTVVGVPDESQYGWFNITSTQLNNTPLQEIADGIKDSEPDMFNFNIGGYSGKFVFPINVGNSNTAEPTIIPRQDVKITRIISSGDLQGFKVILPDGTVYIFGQYSTTSAVETSRPLPQSTEVKSGWYLLRIESHDQKHSINFSYTSEKYHYPYPASAEYYYISQSSPCFSTGSYGVKYLNIYGEKINYNYIEGKRLTEISNSGGTQTVTFVATVNRTDVDSEISYEAKRLERIDIENGSSHGNRYDFSYSYLTSPSDQYDIGNGTTSSSWYKRLRLESIQEKSLNGSTTINPWSFTYHGSSSSLPHRLSYAVDHWGFYNGVTSNGQYPVNVPPTQVGSYYYGSSDRDRDEGSMKNGSLVKVTYPTLGFTEYEFGANRYLFPASSSSSFVLHDEVTSCYSYGYNHCCTTAVSTGSTFTLTSTQIADAEVDYDLILGDPAGGCNNAPRTITLKLYSTTTGLKGTQSFSEGPNVPTEQPSVRIKLTDGFGSLSAGNYYFTLETENAFGKAKLFVKQAIEKDVGGLRIEQITHKTKSGTVLNSSTFDYTESGSSISSGQLYVEPVYGDQVEDLSTYNHTFFRDMSVVPLAGFDGYHIGYERVVENKSGHGKTEHLFTVETRTPVTTYPQVPDVFLVKNGQEDAMKVYNQAGTVLQSTTNTYTEDYQSLNTSPFKVFYFIHNAIPTDCYYFRVATYTIRTGYNLISNRAEYADGMQYATAYTYVTADQLFPISETTTNSDGSVHKTEYSYPANYPAGTIKTTLQNQNRKLPAWKTIKKVDNVKVDGDSTIFSFYNTSNGVPTGSATTLLYPYKSHRYEMSWNSSGTAVVDGWELQSTTDKVQVNVGFPAEVTIDGWSDPLEYTWQANGLLEEWAFIGHSKQYDYYTNSSLLEVFTDVDETTLTYTWDALMRLQDVTDCKGVKTALGYFYRHTTNNALINRINTTVTYPTLGAATNKSLTNTTFFDDMGKPIQTFRYQQNPASSSSSIAEQLVYNTIGRLTQKHEPVSASHSPTSYADALTDYTLTTYETSPLERPAQIQPPSTGTLGRIQYQYGTNSTNEVYDYVHSQYYAAGKLHKTVAIDANGNETHTFVDALGRTVLIRRKEGGSSTLVNTYTLYDDKNRPYLILPPGTTTANTNLIFRKVYSGDDQILMQDDPDQEPEMFGYDNRELMIYRQDGNMSTNSQWYTIEYDEYGRSVKEGFSTSADGTVDETLITNTYGTSGITKDKLEHSTAKLMNGPGTINNHFYYDDCGRLIEENRNSTIGLNTDTSCVLIYTWDSADNPLTITIRTPNGSDRLIVLNTNEYDHAGRWIRDKIKINAYSETLLSQTIYTVKEQVSQLKLGPNAGSPLQTVDFTYLPNRLLKKINDPAALSGDQFGMQLYYDTVFTSSGITARKNGDISNIVWKTPQDANRQHYGFAYDYLDRMTLADYSQYSGSHTATDRYNVVYQYDNRGNMTFVERRGANNAAATTFGPIDDLTYHYYTGTNCLQSIEDDQGIYGYNENGGGNYTYDDNGNITRDPSKKCDLHYNYLNKLDSIVLDNGISLHFYHDAIGRLHQKSTRDAQGATKDRYYFDQVELLNGHVDFVHHANGYIHMLYAVDDELVLTGTESMNNHEYQAIKISSSRTTSGNRTITYTAGEIDMLQPFQVDSASSVTAQIQNFTPTNLAYTYVIRDHLGNNRVFFWDSTGNNSLSTSEIRAVRSYYPFGMDMRQANNTNKEFKYGFGDKEEMELTSYWQFGERCLDASTCRFTSPDPLSTWAPAWNPFRFGFCSPINYSDPLGLFESREAANRFKDEYGINGKVKRDGDTYYIKGKGDNKGQQYAYNSAAGGYGTNDAAVVRGLHLADIGFEGYSQLNNFYSERYNPNAHVKISPIDFAYAFGHALGFALPTTKMLSVSTTGKTMLQAASEPSKNGLSVVGRALQKHGNRVGSIFPKAKGTPSEINTQAEEILKAIVNNPNAKTITRHHARFGEIMDITLPNGQGVRFSADGKTFLHFLEP